MNEAIHLSAGQASTTSMSARPAKLSGLQIVEQGWNELGRPGQAILLGAALVAVMGLMLASAGSAYAGACSSVPDVAGIDMQAYLPRL